MEFTAKENQALKFLGRANQSLIWFDSLITPIKSILSDDELEWFIEKCEEENILNHVTGFMSMAYQPPKFIPTSTSIVTFQKPGQLQLF